VLQDSGCLSEHNPYPYGPALDWPGRLFWKPTDALNPRTGTDRRPPGLRVGRMDRPLVQAAMMDTWREWLDVLVGAAVTAWNGLFAGASAAWSSVVEAAVTFRYTPAIENALIAWCIVSGVGMFVAAALGAWWGGRK